uniref:RNA-polymerase II-associated protein 3-like C-terminal domain-containing protein n=1 Tax=Chromera velia CCMP2878 TaxID=1169474 RepID=A0A0G4I2B9_9ALVE|eukprot:Cvel_10291.t1-p1 / transcript=Cvel_10291.t1 / gene=Cvel_10291 / organism=Chromera_velia_CCMP2878 / gene_product=hypothetical protein / transcript_product=hypothetical protein / location=Cvel_scaffold618:8893-10789(+) / protein_length=227 / sequence_SO=supercontig / SO=protein_coding / is_pseudo=false
MAVRDVTKREGSTTEEKGCKDSNSSKKEKEKEGAQLKPKPQNNSTSSSLRPSVESQKAAKGEKETGKEGEGALPPSEKGSSTEPTRSGGANSSSGARPSLQPQGPQTISNFYAFEREWRRLVDAGDAKGRMDLIQNSVRPSRLAPLVRDSLDSELLGSLIETLWEELKAGGGEGEEGAGAERVAEVLEGVAKLRRLSVVSQCLLDDEIESSRLVSALRSGFGSVLES